MAVTMLGTYCVGPVAVTVFRLASSCSAHSRTAAASVVVGASSPEVSSTTR